MPQVLRPAPSVMQLSLTPDQKDRSHNLSARPTTSITEFMTRTTKRVVLFWLFGFGPSDVMFSFPLDYRTGSVLGRGDKDSCKVISTFTP